MRVVVAPGLTVFIRQPACQALLRAAPGVMETASLTVRRLLGRFADRSTPTTWLRR